MNIDFIRLVVPQKIISYAEFVLWKMKDSPVPPPHLIKQQIVKDFQKYTGAKTFIETGTYRGDMVEAQKNKFEKIISIELSKELYKKAKQRFAKEKQIKILYGDSSELLPAILKKLSGSAIFWLDGHYSGGMTAKGNKFCPIEEELKSIFKYSKNDHILLIDDARLFTGNNDYPTIKKLQKIIKKVDNNYKLTIKDDIIRISK